MWFWICLFFLLLGMALGFVLGIATTLWDQEREDALFVDEEGEDDEDA